MVAVGRHVLGAAAIFLGAVGMWWGDFAAVWQPVPEMAGRTALAYLTALALLAAGASLQPVRSARAGALGLALLFTLFGLLWLPRVIGYPQIFAVWAGAAEQFAVAAGAVLAYASVVQAEIGRESGIEKAARMIFGLCAIAFGLNHFFALPETAAMVPKWMPLSGTTWAIVTGAAHALAGVAITSGLCGLPAARLLTAMFVAFQLLVWAPGLFLTPGNHVVWAGNAVNLTMVGAAWMVADHIANLRPRLPVPVS